MSTVFQNVQLSTLWNLQRAKRDLLLVSPLEKLPKITPLGCYIEKRKSARLLKIKFGSFTKIFNESDPYATAVQCAHLARDMNYQYFAVQNYVDCYTDTNIADIYDKYGEALPENCVGGVGALMTNFVYRLGSDRAESD